MESCERRGEVRETEASICGELMRMDEDASWMDECCGAMPAFATDAGQTSIRAAESCVLLVTDDSKER